MIDVDAHGEALEREGVKSAIAETVGKVGRRTEESYSIRPWPADSANNSFSKCSAKVRNH